MSLSTGGINRTPLRLLLAFLLVLAGAGARGDALAARPSLDCKQFPPGFFYKFHKITLKEREKVLANIAATLRKLNSEGYGLIVKGTAVEQLRPDKKFYDKLTILDNSGLIIRVRRVPNIYYGYAGRPAINQNLYIIIKNVKVNFIDSYIKYAFIVEGVFVAYADKFVHAIRQDLEGAEEMEGPSPKKP
jgi:hypothetical protein